jgi:hypothetical protein
MFENYASCFHVGYHVAEYLLVLAQTKSSLLELSTIPIVNVVLFPEISPQSWHVNLSPSVRQFAGCCCLAA